MTMVMVRSPCPSDGLGAEFVFCRDGEEQSLVSHDVVDNAVREIMRTHETTQVCRMDAGLHHKFSKLVRVLRKVLKAHVGELGNADGSRLEGQGVLSVTAFVSD